MIGLAPEIFQQSRTIAASSLPRHFLSVAFFYALLTLPLAHYPRTSDVASITS